MRQMWIDSRGHSGQGRVLLQNLLSEDAHFSSHDSVRGQASFPGVDVDGMCSEAVLRKEKEDIPYTEKCTFLFIRVIAAKNPIVTNVMSCQDFEVTGSGRKQLPAESQQ